MSTATKHRESAAGTPPWLEGLSDEDLQFVRRFVLASGSLKEIASQYDVSYPTVRARLDRLIAKIRALESPKTKDPFEQKIQVLVAENRLPIPLAKELLSSHRASLSSRRRKS